MKCPWCDSETKVSESFRDNSGIYRMRKCLNCGFRFPTAELVADGKKFNKLKYLYYKSSSTEVY